MRTSIPLALLVLLSMTSVQASQLDLVVNGAFEDPLAQGWAQTTAGANCLISRQQDADEDDDYEVQLRKGLTTGHAKIWQRTAIPSTDLQFSVDLAIEEGSGNGAWGAGGIYLHYLDQHGNILGRTGILAKSSLCPWTASDTFHIIEVPSSDWAYWSFNVADELLYLGGVDPNAVKELEVILAVEASDC